MTEAQPPTRTNNAVLHAQAAVTIAALALGVAMHARLLALFRVLTQGGSVARNLLARSLRLHLILMQHLIRIVPCMHSLHAHVYAVR